MSIDGTYAFVYCGDIGLGVGIFEVREGRFAGQDMMAGKYKGTATENADGTISIEVLLEVPPGVGLVLGTAPQEVQHTRRVTHTFPSAFGDGTPQVVVVSPGTVTLMVKRAPDWFANYAHEGFQLAPRNSMLTIRPTRIADEPIADDFEVFSGERRVGRIYEDLTSAQPEARWYWMVNGVHAGPSVMQLQGRVSTLEDAKAQVRENWQRWLAWAKLSELPQ